MFKPEKMLTTTQAAELCGISYGSIVKAMTSGELKYKPIGKHRKTTESWLAEWQSDTGEKKAAPKFEYKPKGERRRAMTPDEIKEMYLPSKKSKRNN